MVWGGVGWRVVEGRRGAVGAGAAIGLVGWFGDRAQLLEISRGGFVSFFIYLYVWFRFSTFKYPRRGKKGRN